MAELKIPHLADVQRTAEYAHPLDGNVTSGTYHSRIDDVGFYAPNGNFKGVDFFHTLKNDVGEELKLRFRVFLDSSGIKDLAHYLLDEGYHEFVETIGFEETVDVSFPKGKSWAQITSRSPISSIRDIEDPLQRAEALLDRRMKWEK